MIELRLKAMERGRTPRLTLLLVLAYAGTYAAGARQHTAPRELRVAPPRRPLLALRGGAKPYTRETAALLAWKLRTAKEPKAPPPRSVGLRNAGIAINLVLWWTLNVVFNLANKECLNSWPHPWALATLHLAVGSVCMLPLWLPLRRARDDEGRVVWKPVRQPPRLTGAEVRRLLPVAALLSTGHVTSTLAPAFGTVAFSNIVKTAEPLFTCFFSYVLYRRIFPAQVYISLLLVVAGVALVSTRDVNFSSFSLGAGMISNAAFALYAIRAKARRRARRARRAYDAMPTTRRAADARHPPSVRRRCSRCPRSLRGRRTRCSPRSRASRSRPSRR